MRIEQVTVTLGTGVTWGLWTCCTASLAQLPPHPSLPFRNRGLESLHSSLCDSVSSALSLCLSCLIFLFHFILVY